MKFDVIGTTVDWGEEIEEVDTSQLETGDNDSDLGEEVIHTPHLHSYRFSYIDIGWTDYGLNSESIESALNILPFTSGPQPNEPP